MLPANAWPVVNPMPKSKIISTLKQYVGHHSELDDLVHTAMVELWEAAAAQNKARLVSSSLHKSGFTYDGTFDNVVFVTDYAPGDHLGGDGRLVIDLGARLAEAMNIKHRHLESNMIDPTDPKNHNALYITVNCKVAERHMHKSCRQLSVAISNDINSYARDNNTDFRFESHFREADYGHLSPTVFKINTLPSRITPEIIADAAAKNAELKTNGKPLIAIMIRDQLPDHIEGMEKIAKSLAKRHAARFVLCAGLSTDYHMRDDLSALFKKIPDTIKYPWINKSDSYFATLGAATHFVTSGTLSTTSDLLATGKPVYYLKNDAISRVSGKIRKSCNGRLRTNLFRDGAVKLFSEKIVDTPPPAQSIRTWYAEEWKRVGAEFATALRAVLERHSVPNTPGFGLGIAGKQAAYT